MIQRPEMKKPNLHGTPLGNAIREDDKEGLERALLAGENPSEPDWGSGDGLSALMVAVKERKLWAVERLVKEKGLEDMNPRGHTAMHMAVGMDRADMVRALLLAGANVEGRTGDQFGRTPLGVAARNGAYKTIPLLVEMGADMEAQDREGNTPVRITLNHGELEAAKVLVENGADLLSQSDKMWRDGKWVRVKPGQDITEWDALIVLANVVKERKELALESGRGEVRPKRKI